MTHFHRPGADFHLACDYSCPDGSRLIAGHHSVDGDPVPGDLLILPREGGSTERWAVLHVDYPMRPHHPNLADVWSAECRLAPPVQLRLVA